MDGSPTSEWDSTQASSFMRSRNRSPPLHRTPSPSELLNGVRGALEGKLGRRESPDNLISRNILRAHPTTAGRVATGAQELKWKQTQDTIGAHLKEKLSKDPPTSNGVQENTFQDRQEAVKQALDSRVAHSDLVKRGVIVESELTNYDASSSMLPTVGRRRSVPSSVPPLPLPNIVNPQAQSPASTPSQSPVISPFSNVRRKRASSLVVPGSRSTTPVQHDDDETSNASHVRVTRNYTHLLTTEARNIAHDFVNSQMSQNGMMVQRLEGEAGIPYLCCTGNYVWAGYKGGTVLAFQSLCMEPNEELRQEPVSSHSYIRALISVGSHVWCGNASGEIQIWDGSDGELLNTVNAHPGVGVSALFYSERCGQVWSGGGDGKVYAWNTAGKCVRRMGQSHSSAVRIIAQIGNHVWTIADSASGAFLWDADHAHDRGTHPNGNTVFANGKPSRISVHSPVPFTARSPTPPPRKIRELHGDAEETPASVVHLGPGILCLLAVPHHESSGTVMWAGTTEGVIRVIDTETKEVVRTLTGHASQVNAMLLVGAHVWSASNDKSIRIWSAKSMDCLRTISDAHTSAIYSLCLSGSHVWSGSTDRSIRVWLAAGAHDLLGAFLETALQGIYELEGRHRKVEEKLVQSEAQTKQSAEEIASLRLKLKTQAGEAMNAKHEMELLAQEVASVDQWQRKMQALKAVYHSDKAVLKDKLAKAHDFIEQQDAEMYDMREKLREADANVYRLQSERNAMEAEARELALLLQKVEADSNVYAAKLQQLEKKEKEDSELRKRLEMKVRESQENETRLRQSVLLLEHKFAKSAQKSTRPSSSLSGKMSVFRRRSSTIGGGESASFPPMPFSSDLTGLNGLGPSNPAGLTRPYIPRLKLGNDAGANSAKVTATIDESDTVRIGDSEEGETMRETDEEEGEGEYDEEEKREGEGGEEELEMTDVTVSLLDVLGMVKYKGERTTALQDRIQKLSHRLQELQHQRHVQHLQQLHQQMDQKEEERGEREEGRVKERTNWVGWILVFVVLVGGLGLILFLMLRKNVYFSSLHPS